MPTQILAQNEMAIRSADDVVLVRRRVRDLAQKHGFDAFGTAAITTATSELSRNTWVHGHGGTAVLFEITNGRRKGVGAQSCTGTDGALTTSVETEGSIDEALLNAPRP